MLKQKTKTAIAAINALAGTLLLSIASAHAAPPAAIVEKAALTLSSQLHSAALSLFQHTTSTILATLPTAQHQRAAHLAAAPLNNGNTSSIDRFTTASIAKAKLDRPTIRSTKSAQTGVFGTVAISFKSLPAVGKLNDITRRPTESRELCNDQNCKGSTEKFWADIAALEGERFQQKLQAVNELVNRHITYSRDADNYGQTDYWASPAETLSRRAGDCEDYAILKMAALRKLGVPASSMSVVILRDDRRNLFHAVLSIRTTQGHFVLDNVRQEVLADSKLTHYTPLYSVSAGKGYIHGRRAGDGRTAMSNIRFDAIAPGEGP